MIWVGGAPSPCLPEGAGMKPLEGSPYSSLIFLVWNRMEMRAAWSLAAEHSRIMASSWSPAGAQACKHVCECEWRHRGRLHAARG